MKTEILESPIFFIKAISFILEIFFEIASHFAARAHFHFPNYFVECKTLMFISNLYDFC